MFVVRDQSVNFRLRDARRREGIRRRRRVHRTAQQQQHVVQPLSRRQPSAANSATASPEWRINFLSLPVNNSFLRVRAARTRARTKVKALASSPPSPWRQRRRTLPSPMPPKSHYLPRRAPQTCPRHRPSLSFASSLQYAASRATTVAGRLVAWLRPRESNESSTLTVRVLCVCECVCVCV